MDLHVEIAAETLFHIGPIPITNSMLTMWIIMALLILVGAAIARGARMIPSRGQSLFELVLEFIMGLVIGTAGRKLGRRMLPLVAGLFIFILFSNYSGLLPGVGTIGVYREPEHAAETTTTAQTSNAALTVASAASDVPAAESAKATASHDKVLVPFLRAPNADLNMTLAMALVTFTMVQIYGVRAHGAGGRIKHMANPPFLFPIEVISELSRIISLSARLFGNVFAGEVLLGVMYAMGAAIKIAVVPFLFPVVFLFLEVMFGTIQALVFALLTTIYITLAAAHGHDEEHAHGAEHAPAAQAAHGSAGD